MARVDLPNGKWVEMRGPEQLNAGDRLAIRRVQQVPVVEGITMISAGFREEQRMALLSRLITAWNYEGWPIPSLALDAQAAIEQLPIDAYDALTLAVNPHMELVDYYPSPSTSGESSDTSADSE